MATAEGDVTALDRATGARLWRQPVGPVAAAPTLAGDGLLVVEPGALRLLDVVTGEPLAERAFAGTTLVGATVTRGGTYVATGDGGLFALR